MVYADYGGVLFFFFNDTATTEIYTLSLHDALPISGGQGQGQGTVHLQALRRSRDQRGAPVHPEAEVSAGQPAQDRLWRADRKSTRLNSSHANISYAVFCLKKKKKLWHEETPDSG